MTTRILIADDHPIVLAGIRDVLAGELDLDVVGEAADPATLIELMTSTQPHAVITDYSMPGGDSFGDGIKLISFLRRSFPDTHVLVLTMVSNPSLVAAMYAAGAGGVVLKSHGLGSLVQALRTVLADRIYRPPGLMPVAAAEPADADPRSSRLGWPAVRRRRGRADRVDAGREPNPVRAGLARRRLGLGHRPRV